jgi:hypothetical protein
MIVPDEREEPAALGDPVATGSEPALNRLRGASQEPRADIARKKYLRKRQKHREMKRRNQRRTAESRGTKEA